MQTLYNVCYNISTIRQLQFTTRIDFTGLRIHNRKIVCALNHFETGFSSQIFSHHLEAIFRGMCMG